MYRSKWRKKFFKQLASFMDYHQLHWILTHDYPQWEKEIVKQQLEKRFHEKVS